MRKCRYKPCRAPLKPLKECQPGTFEKAGFCCGDCMYHHKRLRIQEQVARAHQKPQKPRKARAKPKTLARLKNDAADLLQKLVRLKAADGNGMVLCVTCDPPKFLHWKEAQGGHFLERGRGATKLLEENIHPQCPGCNLYRMKQASTVLAYRRYMVDMYGEDFVRDLELKAKQPCTLKRPEVMAMIEDLKQRVKALEAEAA